MRNWSHSYLACLALAALACEHDARLGFACPGPSPSCVRGAAADSGDTIPSDPRPAADGGKTTPRLLSVEIVTGAGMPVAEAQLACGVACLEVLARASGGEPPYSYEWDGAVGMPERSLCPDETTRYTVRVRDSQVASGTAELDLTRGACPADAGTGCRRFSVGEYAACGNVGTADDMPQLRAAQPHTLRIYSNLTTAGDMQVTAVGESCSDSEPLQTFSLPAGPAEQPLCLTPTRDAATLMITVTSGGGSAAFLTNPDSYVELCGGCD